MSTSNTRDKSDSSPCIGKCSHNVGDYICKGCGRTVEEVRDWNNLSPEFKIAVKELAKWRLGKEEV